MLATTATLCEEMTQRVVHLLAHHVLGRSAAKADTLLDCAEASQIHASIRWSGEQWLLADHSKNGTFVDGRRIAPNLSWPLKQGQKIEFTLNSGQLWRVTDVSPPLPMLMSSQTEESKTGGAIVLSSACHALPVSQEPELLVYRDGQGAWCWESETGSGRLIDGDTVRTAHASWRFVSNQPVGVTRETPRGGPSPAQQGRSAIELTFKVSQNEEHVELIAHAAGVHADLGERAHHFCLLTLARLRHADALRGFDETSQGWVAVGDISTMLGLDAAHLNIHIFRARHQFGTAFSASGLGIDVVERRRGEVRFGTIAFRILRGGAVEANFSPSTSRLPTSPPMKVPVDNLEDGVDA